MLFCCSKSYFFSTHISYFGLCTDQCGLEVEPNYPHNEVRDRLHLNHFPKGVFQDCRTVIRTHDISERRQRAGGGGGSEEQVKCMISCM